MDKLHDEIARVAYSLYEKRGKAEGLHVSDWLEAERIVMALSGPRMEAPREGVRPATGRTAAGKPEEGRAAPEGKTAIKKKTAVKPATATQKPT